MSIWSKITNVFRKDRMQAEFDEEFQTHIEEAIENGRDPAEVRRAFGSLLRKREDCQDVKLASWLDSLRSDIVFGWRQLLKHKVVSAAAVLSLALAAGACTSAFRLIDALLLRPLPVANPERLHFLEYGFQDASGKIEFGDSFEYPLFRDLRKSVQGQAELMAISYSSRVDLTYGSDQEMEKGYRQWVSGWMFGAFGLKPALGRLLTESDDLKPDSHPYAVLSYDYWSRRFGRDPNVIGKTMKVGKLTLEIVGVCEPGFTGTETGTLTDFWVSTMMNGRAINNPNWGWFRTWVKLRDGASIDQIREKLQASMTNFRREKSKDFKAHGMSQQQIDRFVNSRLQVEPSFAGVSGMQKQYKRPLGVLAVVVLLVLLIACANVANLMAAQATARAREMALRVSIGAGRLRLLQLVLVESGIVAALAMVIGGLFAIWAAPFVVSMINPPDNPARLILPADWRVMGFAGALTLVITGLFGTMPAFRASGVKPMSVLRGGESPRSRHRIMQLLTAAQMAFCVLVLFVTGLFITTFRKVSNQPTGFEPKGVLTLEMAAKAPQPYEHWDQVTDHLRSVSGVQSAAICSWPLMSGNGWTGGVFIGGQPRHDGGPEPYFLGVGQGWIDAMKIQWIDGRDLRREDVYPKSVIVNESFAKRFFNGENPVGRTFGVMEGKTLIDATVVGYVKDARYRNMREAIRPTVYGPYRTLDKDGALNKNDWGTLVVRMPSGMDPLAMASRLREEVKAARPEFRVSEVNTQEELVRSHLVRERLLAVLSSFFAVVALALAGIGLFGVIQYSMLQRRREIGIRMALGARAADVARRVTAQSFLMLTLGAVAGLSIGLATSQYIETLLFEVKAQDASMLSTPALVLLATAIAAAIPPVIQAVRLDPASMLRTE